MGERASTAQRQVRAADRPGEQAVAHERDPVPVKAHMTGGVSRHLPDAERQLPASKRLAVRQLVVRRRGLLDAEPEEQRVLRRVVVQRAICGMEIDGSCCLTLDGRNATYVIDVRMREPDRAHGPAERFCRTQQALPFLTRVDEHRVAGCVVDQDVRVLLKGPNGEGADDHAIALIARPPDQAPEPRPSAGSGTRQARGARAIVRPRAPPCTPFRPP